MLNFHKPRWLYETLPYLYVGSGIANLTTLDHLLSLFSGLMLVSAGIVVWKLRHDHRRWDWKKDKPPAAAHKMKAPLHH